MDNVRVASKHFLNFYLLINHLLDNSIATILTYDLQSEPFALSLDDIYFSYTALSDFAAYLVINSSNLDMVIEDHLTIIIDKMVINKMTGCAVVTRYNPDK